MANKIDLERSVTKEEGEDFAKSKSITYSETSAKTGLNIKETFNNLYNEIFQLKGKGKGSFDIRRLSKPKSKKSSFC